MIEHLNDAETVRQLRLHQRRQEHLTRAQMEERRISAIPDLLAIAQLNPHGAAHRHPDIKDLARKYRVSRKTVYHWRSKALAAVMEMRDAGGALAGTKATGRPWFVHPDLLRAIWTPGMTGRAFADAIERAYGVRYHEDSAGVLMHRLGLK